MSCEGSVFSGTVSPQEGGEGPVSYSPLNPVLANLTQEREERRNYRKVSRTTPSASDQLTLEVYLNSFLPTWTCFRFNLSSVEGDIC